jgi:ketosteroid isomerase-like protein
VTGEDRRGTNLEMMRAHFRYLDEPNPDAVMGQLAADFVFDLPFAPELEPFDRAQYDALIRHNHATYESHLVTILEELPTLDPDVIAVRFDGDSRWAGGIPYVGRYVAIFRFRDGKIVGITEFHNPKVVEAAMAASKALARQA